ncbi:hypothetical protein BKA69DRAFT_1126317 [Paraphysoderma sedebokerense]|nr:hypothetical protein BKA69DRAFT_1126317 [Paraphysoderma sedebokerense]
MARFVSYRFPYAKYKSAPNGNRRLLLIIVILALMVTTLGQSRWQDLRRFHPYCIRLFRTCVETSTSGVSAGDYDAAVGICGNKMAICTSSNTLRWPWSTSFLRPASPLIDANSRLNTYQNAVNSSATAASSAPWQDLSEFLPDCRSEFRRCSDGMDWHDATVGICGHAMSVCTKRQGRWPLGNDSSLYWQVPFPEDRLQIYRTAYSLNNGTARNWQNSAVFLPICRNMMAQCVAAYCGPSIDVAVETCGNQMSICTYENIFWPHTADATAAYTEPYDTRWQRWLIDLASRWQDVTRFSLFCIDDFFRCVFTSGGPSSDAVVGVCGNRMSLCTFNENVWPAASRPATPFQTEPYIQDYLCTVPCWNSCSLTTLLPGANLTLKYRGTKDGWSSITFHTMCHDVAPNFAVFRTTLNVIFTAYTPVAFTLSPWTFQRPTVDFYRPAPAGSAWLNNLENRTGAINTTRFFNTKNPESTIFDMNRYGPNYGFGWDIFTDDPININGTADEWTYVGSEGIAGTRRFNLTELEFYHVTYDNQLP